MQARSSPRSLLYMAMTLRMAFVATESTLAEENDPCIPIRIVRLVNQDDFLDRAPDTFQIDWARLAALLHLVANVDIVVLARCVYDADALELDIRAPHFQLDPGEDAFIRANFNDIPLGALLDLRRTQQLPIVVLIPGGTGDAADEQPGETDDQKRDTAMTIPAKHEKLHFLLVSFCLCVILVFMFQIGSVNHRGIHSGLERDKRRAILSDRPT
jgi:hypothetical protein